MAISPLAVFGISAALSGLLLLGGASHWLYEKRARMQRVRTATGKRAGRIVTQGSVKQPKNSQLQQGALAFMKLSTKGVSIMKGRQSARRASSWSAPASARATRSSSSPSSSWSRRWSSSPAPRSTSTASNPIGKGPMVDLAAVMARGAARQQAARDVS